MAEEQRSSHYVGGYLVVEPGCAVIDKIASFGFSAQEDESLYNPSIDSFYKVYFTVWCGLIPPIYLKVFELPSEEELDSFLGAVLTLVLSTMDDGFQVEHWDLQPSASFEGRNIGYGY